MLAIEKGVDIPLSPSSAPRKERHRNPYLWAFILIGLGIAMMFSDILGGDFDFGAKLIPLMIGLAMLLAHSVFTKYKKKHGLTDNGNGNDSMKYMMNSKAAAKPEEKLDRSIESATESVDLKADDDDKGDDSIADQSIEDTEPKSEKRQTEGSDQ